MALVPAKPYEYHGRTIDPARMPNGEYTEYREETCPDCGWDREITIVSRGRRRYRSTFVGLCGCTVAA
jgi:hypothetical protein